METILKYFDDTLPLISYFLGILLNLIFIIKNSTEYEQYKTTTYMYD